MMERQPTEAESQGGPQDGDGTQNGPSARNYSNLHGQNALDTVAWYLMATGFMALAAAGLFIFMKTIHYRDYALNGSVLGRYLLVAGIFCYFAGRSISYYRRFQRRKEEREADD